MSKKSTYTLQAYVVRDSNTRRFLNRPTYSGRVRGVWGRLGEASLFFDRDQAQSCASNINHRRPEGYSAYNAQVREMMINIKK